MYIIFKQIQTLTRQQFNQTLRNPQHVTISLPIVEHQKESLHLTPH